MTNTPQETTNDAQTTHEDPVRDYIGYVKWFDSKGYGFVRILTPGDQYEHDVFVHQSNVHPSVQHTAHLEKAKQSDSISVKKLMIRQSHRLLNLLE